MAVFEELLSHTGTARPGLLARARGVQASPAA